MDDRAASAKTELTAGQIMSTPAIACREDALFEEIAEVFADRAISGVPVVDGSGAVVGVVSERDIAHALGGPLVRLAVRRPVHTGPSPRLPHDVPPGARRVGDAMTSPAMTVHPDTPLHALAEIMVKERVNRVPVIRAGRLVGVVTRTDVLGAFAGLEGEGIGVEEPAVVVGSVWDEVEPPGVDLDETGPEAARGARIAAG